MLGYAWAAPYTALGMLLGCVALLAGGWWRTRAGAIEFGGGRAGRLVARLPPPFSFAAMTLGHVILGIDAETLDRVRAHEQVHVRQYERWGALFLPAYLLSSVAQVLRGRRPHRDNRFEREAYARERESHAAPENPPRGSTPMPFESGFYARRIFPWLNERLCSDPALQALRRDALQSARGRLVEIGFGSGLNLAHYPPAVTGVVGIEPNPGMADRAQPRVAASSLPVEMIAGSAEAIPLADASFDTAVSVLTLCTVADPGRALAELRRVLRADGRLLLVEHGLAPDAGVARWQRRLNGVQRVLACGCNLDRPVADLVRSSGFEFESVRQFYVAGMPRTHGWVTIAVAAAAPGRAG
jgi:SAM-dependent methyltransferase